jgi:RNA polymerase sigma-70 factor (ECF subfamily)
LTQEEFASLALGYLDDLTAFARRLSRNAADADDLVQGAFERAFRSWRDLRHPRACRAWLFQIARNLHLNRQRLVSSRPELHLVDAEESLLPGLVVPPETVERLAARELEMALERLPPDQRDAVLLCDLWGFEYEEIATITGWPLGTVRSRIARGRTRLGSILAAKGAKDSRGSGQP